MSNNAEPVSTEPEPNAPRLTTADVKSVEDVAQPVTIRRSPRYFRLMTLGAGVGAVIAFISTLAAPASKEYSQIQVFGFLLLFGLIAGCVLGALVGLVLDRLVGRKTVSAMANKVAVNESSQHESSRHESSQH